MEKENINIEPNKIIDGERGEKIEIFENKAIIKTTIPQQIIPEKVEETEISKENLLIEQEHLTIGIANLQTKLAEINKQLAYFN